ncbi:MAG: PspC domain-containing protein [Bacteroidota bacterium]
MATRRRRSSRSNAESEDLLSDEFSDVSEEDILAYMAEIEAEADEEKETKDPGFLNLQTGAGMGLIGIGALYVMQLTGILGIAALPALVAIAPWIAGILIMLTGFGVLSWSPAARRRRKARERAARAAARRRQKTMGRERRRRRSDEAGRRARNAFEQAEKASRPARRKAREAIEASRERTRSMTAGRKRGRRLAKSRKSRKITGVASGIAEYFGIDPTVVRILFVLGTMFGGPGAGLIIYILLSFILPDAKEERDDDPVIRLSRD